MRLNLVKVGNSKGIIIPAALLAACELKDTVELQVKGRKLVIEASRQPRAGWFDNCKPEPGKDAFDAIPLDEGIDEWSW